MQKKRLKKDTGSSHKNEDDDQDKEFPQDWKDWKYGKQGDEFFKKLHQKTGGIGEVGKQISEFVHHAPRNLCEYLALYVYWQLENHQPYQERFRFHYGVQFYITSVTDNPAHIYQVSVQRTSLSEDNLPIDETYSQYFNRTPENRLLISSLFYWMCRKFGLDNSRILLEHNDVTLLQRLHLPEPMTLPEIRQVYSENLLTRIRGDFLNYYERVSMPSILKLSKNVPELRFFHYFDRIEKWYQESKQTTRQQNRLAQTDLERYRQYFIKMFPHISKKAFTDQEDAIAYGQECIERFIADVIHHPIASNTISQNMIRRLENFFRNRMLRLFTTDKYHYLGYRLRGG